jgi:hypothetical protein
MELYEAYYLDNHQAHHGDNRRPYIVAACMLCSLGRIRR